MAGRDEPGAADTLPADGLIQVLQEFLFFFTIHKSTHVSHDISSKGVQASGLTTR